jgi:methylphosphotriester-DNA--protein-cysteine methyltransferase
VTPYRLLGPDGEFMLSYEPGRFGGNSRLKIYGRLDCPSAVRSLSKGYAKVRVFFADEATALAAGYRPCGACMRAQYRIWKESGRERDSETRS